MASDIQFEINGELWDYWSNVTLTERCDSIAQVELTSSFDAARQEFRDNFRPFSYNEVSLFVGGELRFSGTMMTVQPRVTESESLVSITAYSRSGVLADVTPTPEQFPIEYKNLKLDKIAKQLCEPIGIEAVLGADAGSVFEKVQLKPGQKILDFLIGLAKQRSLLVRSDQDGNLLFYKANENAGDVVATLSEDRPVLEITPSFNTQEYFSTITGISKTKGGKTGSKFTVENPAFPEGGNIRPWVYELNDTDPADVPSAVRSRVGRMNAETISYDIDLASEVDQNGFYWEPDRFITLEAPKAMVYKETPLYIRESKLIYTPDSRSAKLNCVLPGSFSGELPKGYPWEEF